MPEIRSFRDGDWYDAGSLTAERLTLRDELDRLRKDANAQWAPFRWLLNRKLDRLEAILDETRDAAIQRYFQS